MKFFNFLVPGPFLISTILQKCFNFFNSANQLKSIRDGHIGGPIAFFDRDYTAVVIVSPLNQYMVASTEVDSEEGLINFGLMASVKASVVTF